MIEHHQACVGDTRKELKEYSQPTDTMHRYRLVTPPKKRKVKR